MIAVIAYRPAGLLAVWLIRLYQKYISPYKGFRCAHHALHRRGSCSNYGLEVFKRHSPFAARKLLKGRFRECRSAYLSILASNGETEDKGRRRRHVGGTNGKSTGGIIPFDCPAVDCPVGDCPVGDCGFP